VRQVRPQEKNDKIGQGSAGTVRVAHDLRMAAEPSLGIPGEEATTATRSNGKWLKGPKAVWEFSGGARHTSKSNTPTNKKRTRKHGVHNA
jgi:hypothetical protein